MAIELDASFSRAYFRKATALFEICDEECMQQALETITEGIATVKETEHVLLGDFNRFKARIEAEIESDAKARTFESHSKFTELTEWMTEEGAEFSKLKIIYESNTNRIVRAAKDIKKGETILKVPDACCVGLTEAHHAVDPLVKQVPIGEGLGQHSADVERFAFHTALEMKKGEDSVYAKYFNILPKELMNDHVIFFNEQELALLENSNLLVAYKSVRGVAEKAYNDFKVISDNVTLDEYLRAYAMILSRQFNASG